MKITAKTKDVARALKTAAACMTNRAIVPVLNNVLIEAQQGKVSLTCTDIEKWVTASFSAEVEAPEKTTLPAKKLLSILNNLSSDSIVLETQDNHYTSITSGTTKANIAGLPPDDFPDAAQSKAEVTYSIDTKELAGLIRRGGYAAGKNEARKILNGILFEFDKNEIAVVSTDGKRLAVATKFNGPVIAEELKRYVVPATAVSILSALNDGTIELEFSGNFVKAKYGEVELSSKLIDGNFPNWKAVCPASCSESVEINSAVILKKLAIVSNMVGENKSASFTLGDGALEISAQSTYGSITESMEIENKLNGEAVTLNFNPAFIADAASNCGDFKLCFNDNVSPCLLEFSNEAKAVVMPIRSK